MAVAVAEAEGTDIAGTHFDNRGRPAPRRPLVGAAGERPFSSVCSMRSQKGMSIRADGKSRFGDGRVATCGHDLVATDYRGALLRIAPMRAAEKHIGSGGAVRSRTGSILHSMRARPPLQKETSPTLSG
jgi:hypothetical protein